MIKDIVEGVEAEEITSAPTAAEMDEMAAANQPKPAIKAITVYQPEMIKCARCGCDTDKDGRRLFNCDDCDHELRQKYESHMRRSFYENQ